MAHSLNLCQTVSVMVERSFLIVRRSVDQVPSMASCTKCRYKFFTPSDFRRDRVAAEQYLQVKFEMHECREVTEMTINSKPLTSVPRLLPKLRRHV